MLMTFPLQIIEKVQRVDGTWWWKGAENGSNAFIQ